MSLDQPLSAEQRKRIGRIKGGMRAHQLHADLAARAGAAGGRAYVEAHPEVHHSSHGRRLALSRRPRWELALMQEVAIEQ
jgi:hypothetical protein